MRSGLPSGTVTFLFTDVEGSTRLLDELGAEAYAEALAEHRRLIREACAAHDGVEVDTQGDAFFLAFPTAPGALAAAGEMTQALASGPIRVRVGLHTGTPLVTEEGYVGDDIHLAARVAASGHGGQIILSAATAQLTQFELTDLGEHRFKDVAAAVPIYQLGDGSFPPLKTISNTNLPRPASSFVGREEELLDVLARFEAGARLITLTGPGGIGKTRLALEAAASLVPEYKAGVFWVGLAVLRDPALVTETIAQTLGAKDGLAEHISGRELLLLIDNLEQVIEAAPELSALLSACPNLTLLVTSRELLRVQGEVEYPVPPLAEPEAVALFCERAGLERSEKIAELCARLDNLPLAVELAAARAKALSPAQILERLSQRLDLLKGGRDADPRHQTLRATIEWSYELLSEEEQRLFRGLSIFAGGCTLEAAEEVAGASIDALQSLVEKSLLRFSNERYWMLEAIREYGAGELARENEDELTRERHAAWVLDFVREVAPRWGEPAPQASLDKVFAEGANIRLALERAIARREVDPALELAGLIGRSWWELGRVVELEARALEALELPGGDAYFEGLTQVGLGFAVWSADGIDAFERAVELLRSADMPRDAAYATMASGWVHGDALGLVDRGIELLKEALDEFERLGDAYCVRTARQNIDYLLGLRWPLEPSEARRLADAFRKSVAEAARWGDTGDAIGALDNLSHALIDAQELGEARSAASRAAALIRQHRTGWSNITLVAAALARCEGMQGQPERALRLAAAARAAATELGYALPRGRELRLESVEASCAEVLDRVTAARATAAGEAMSADELLEYMTALG